MKRLIIISYFIALFLGVSGSGGAKRQGDTPTPTDSPTATATFHAYFNTPSAMPTMDNRCPGRYTPTWWGSVTPGLDWWLQCRMCAVTLATDVPTITDYPTSYSGTATSTEALHTYRKVYDYDVWASWKGNSTWVYGWMEDYIPDTIVAVILSRAYPVAGQLSRSNEGPNQYAPGCGSGDCPWTSATDNFTTAGNMYCSASSSGTLYGGKTSSQWCDYYCPTCNKVGSGKIVTNKTIRYLLRDLGYGWHIRIQSAIVYGNHQYSPTQQPTITRAATQTYNPNTYCGNYYGGDDTLPSTPIFLIGEGSCQGFDGVTISLGWVNTLLGTSFPDWVIPQIRVCMYPVYLGTWEIIGIAMNMDVIFLIMSCVVVVYWVLRS